MQLSTVIEAVIDDTGKPQKEASIRRRINSIIRMISISGHYWPDRVETTQTFSAKATAFSFATPTRFRSVDYLTYSNGRHLDRKEPSSIKRLPDGEADVYYLAGGNILVKCAESTDTLLFGYWTYPADLTKDADTNWILERLSTPVIDLTSQSILGMLGSTTEKDFIGRLAQAELNIMVTDILRDATSTVISGRA